ncbi:MAG: hypothetical protein JWQ07_4056 [Ramlibacter sp.]|nr:hypothetical protein [Ramlibacter sp.]
MGGAEDDSPKLHRRVASPVPFAVRRTLTGGEHLKIIGVYVRDQVGVVAMLLKQMRDHGTKRDSVDGLLAQDPAQCLVSQGNHIFLGVCNHLYGLRGHLVHHCVQAFQVLARLLDSRCMRRLSCLCRLRGGAVSLRLCFLQTLDAPLRLSLPLAFFKSALARLRLRGVLSLVALRPFFGLAVVPATLVFGLPVAHRRTILVAYRGDQRESETGGTLQRRTAARGRQREWLLVQGNATQNLGDAVHLDVLRAIHAQRRTKARTRVDKLSRAGVENGVEDVPTDRRAAIS